MVRSVKLYTDPNIYGKRVPVYWKSEADTVIFRGPLGEVIILSVYEEGTFSPTAYFWPIDPETGRPETGIPTEEKEFPGKSNLTVALRPAQRWARKKTGLPPYRPGKDRF